MSIRKSLRITILVYSLLPIALILAISHWFLSSRLIASKENTLSMFSDHIAQSIHYQLNNNTDPPTFTNINQYLQKVDTDHSITILLADSFNQILYESNHSFFPVLPTNLLKGNDSDSGRNTNLCTETFYTEINNSHYIFSYRRIHDYGLTLYVFQTADQFIFSPLIMILIFVVTLILLLPFSLLIIHYFTKTYTTPFCNLLGIIQTAANGNLDVQSEYHANNELGELSQSFNRLIYMIKHNYSELSEMHDTLVKKENQLKTNYNHIEYLAYHDILTALPNKLHFNEHINSILAASKLEKENHCILFIDIDNFKIINDTLGHEYGDLLLMQTAERLQSIESENDCIARSGGDEFLFFKANLNSEEEAMEFGSKIINLFKQPFHLNGETAYISLSIGIAIYPDNGLDSHILLKNADIAMYASKESGKNKCTLFNKSMEEHLHRNSVILEVLRNCISTNEIYLIYQPQVNLKENRIVGFEALMRIYNDKLGMISPKEFIPIAEENGLITELGAWAIKEACTVNKHLLDTGVAPCTVSVNISPVQVNHFDFFNTLSTILKETGLPPKYLELELTESTLVNSLIDTASLIRNLQDIGVKVALDDFGTGYSSLSYLAKMSINTLKIDKSFIDNICFNEKELSMVHTIIRLAHHLGIQVIAEGVEHQSQLVLLKEKKCDIVQGFVYSKPLLIQDLINILSHTLTEGYLSEQKII